MTLKAINKKEYEDAIKSGLSEREAIIKSRWYSCFAFMNKLSKFDSNKLILPEYKEFYGFDKPNWKVLKNEQWTFVKKFTKKNGIDVRSYFTPSNKEQEYTKETKEYTPEQTHSIAQDLLLAEFIEGNLKVNYHGISIPLNCFDIMEQDDPENYLEVTKNMKGSTHKEQRRGDLLIEFSSWNEKFGHGIVFEIANTESDTSLQEKEHDWNLNHYSYVSLNVSDFNIHNEQIPSERKINVVAAMDKFEERQMNDINELKDEINSLKIENNNDVKEFKENKNTMINELKDEIDDELTHLKSQTIELQKEISTKLESQEDLAEKLKLTKERLIKEALETLTFDINQQVKEIVDTIETRVKSSINQDIIKKVEDITNGFPDILNKLEHKTFNLCEKNRTFCLNIIKRQADEYFEKKKKEVENNGRS